ncbi:MAG TPA: peptidylprolyl isomerase [Candidatus Acidoferrum sp.]|nr:peptidylprolyl isomerase [Candidatus Acidoferrum sp.]
MKSKNLHFLPFAVACGAVLLFSAQAFAQKGTVVESIVARVNNSVITLSDYQKAEQELRQEVTQDCQGCTPDKIATEFNDQQKDLLRSLIDTQLLVDRAKDMDINVETDLVKRLDDVRKQNNLPTMEELEKAVEQSGMAWEDYKTQIRNKLLTDEVIRREVAGHMDIPPEEVKQFYEAHKQEFDLPEQVVLAEIFLSTEGRTPEEVASVQRKADDLRNRVVKGEDFSLLAQRYSEGSTAKDGGNLGTFQRGQLSKQLEDAVFDMGKGQITDVIQTKTGFEILKVVDRYAAGQQPLEKVHTQIENKLYMQKMEPAMRDYLAQLREESYVMVRPGYTDSAAVPGTGAVQEVSPTPDTSAKKKKKKLSLPKVNGS